MKANELMIGDWVTVLQDDGADVDKQWSVNDYIDTNTEYCEPISITEEILKANGFECFVLPNHKKLYSYNNKEIILFWNDGAEIDLLGVPRTIISVNELQHALRLCGLAELADNFKIE